MKQGVETYFSPLARDYARFRPMYPAELFQWLASLLTSHHLAWDCACGNGQVARGLVDRFERVVATDGSREQLDSAFQHPKIEYRLELAESSSLGRESVDLITVGTAIHWFSNDRFFNEVRRVLKPCGIIAAFGYPPLPEFQDKRLETGFAGFCNTFLRPYHPPQIEGLYDGGSELPFPFPLVQPTPAFEIKVSMTYADMLGYLTTWPSRDRFRGDQGFDPLLVFEKDVAPLWGTGRHIVTWPLTLRVGHM